MLCFFFVVGCFLLLSRRLVGSGGICLDVLLCPFLRCFSIFVFVMTSIYYWFGGFILLFLFCLLAVGCFILVLWFFFVGDVFVVLCLVYMPVVLQAF